MVSRTVTVRDKRRPDPSEVLDDRPVKQLRSLPFLSGVSGLTFFLRVEICVDVSDPTPKDVVHEG